MSVFSVGVEEEYQLVDPVSWDLRSSARAVLPWDWSGDIREELQDSTIEIGTRVCASSAAVAGELRRLRTQAATAAAAEELHIVAAGVHPFADWRQHTLSPGTRFQRIARRYGRVARDEHNFGMHVHVAADGDRMQLINRVRPYIPHLLALSCSSPFYEGEDTGYDSFRMVLWRRWPGAGPPPRLPDDRTYHDYVKRLTGAGILDDERSLYWLIRRHPTYPTVEFRMCDACPSLPVAVAIAGLARVLVGAAAEGALPLPGVRGGEAADALLADACWAAARFGLEARLFREDRPDRWETVGDAVLRLTDRLRPVAARLGEERALHAVAGLIPRGNAASRLRQVHGDAGMPGLMDWLAAETLVGAGMDRRASQRPRAGAGEGGERGTSGALGR
jgi:glutamate---cysteine ligase / carboxylate-amine ligase